MSGQTGSDPKDVVEDDATAFIVAVPDGTNTQFTNFLRLGHNNPTDEGKLQQDPASTTPTLISAWSTTASPFSDGELAYSTGTTQIVAPYGYIRIGTATTYEDWLPSDPSTSDSTITPPPPPSPPPQGSPPVDPPPPTFGAKGIVIYSNDTIQTYSPSIQTTSGTFTNVTSDSLSVVREGPADFQASYTNVGSYKYSSTYQTVNQMNTTVGAVSNLVVGNSLTYWLGNDASTGFGSLLWSNVGSTQNVFGGMIVNIINGMIDVQGWGEVKIQENFSVDVLEGAFIYVSPLVGLQSASAITVSQNLSMAAKIIGVGAGSAVAVLGAGIEGVWDDLTTNPTTMRNLMTAAYGDVALLTGLVAVMQILAIAAGLKAKGAEVAARAAAVASLEVSETGVRLSAGPTKWAITDVGMFTDAVAAAWNHASNQFDV